MIPVARLVSLLTLAASLPISGAKELTVWTPHVISPNKYTIWHPGERRNVTWDTSSPPLKITNPTGKIYLMIQGKIDFSQLLAEDFNLIDGCVLIQVPYVLPGTYRVVLLGDSGDDSDPFSIK